MQAIPGLRQGISIIPSKHVFHGHRWVEGNDIYVNDHDYAVLRTMATEALLVALVHLRDMSRAQKSPIENEEESSGKSTAEHAERPDTEQYGREAAHESDRADAFERHQTQDDAGEGESGDEREMMSTDHLSDIVDHKARVAGYMQQVANDLFRRAAIHDNSKFASPEFEAYSAAFPELQKYPYGSPELKAVYKSIKPALQHHFEVNDHHPEHFEHGVNSMHLIQLIEMLCDWLAASERSQTPFSQGFEMNKERFHLDDQLFEILRNTVERLDPGKFLVVDEIF